VRHKGREFDRAVVEAFLAIVEAGEDDRELKPTPGGGRARPVVIRDRVAC
jgi:hypothetical protein